MKVSVPEAPRDLWWLRAGRAGLAWFCSWSAPQGVIEICRGKTPGVGLTASNSRGGPDGFQLQAVA
jgi:hypothetical protein